MNKSFLLLTFLHAAALQSGSNNERVIPEVENGRIGRIQDARVSAETARNPHFWSRLVLLVSPLQPCAFEKEKGNEKARLEMLRHEHFSHRGNTDITRYRAWRLVRRWRFYARCCWDCIISESKTGDQSLSRDRVDLASGLLTCTCEMLIPDYMDEVVPMTAWLGVYRFEHR